MTFLLLRLLLLASLCISSKLSIALFFHVFRFEMAHFLSDVVRFISKHQLQTLGMRGGWMRSSLALNFAHPFFADESNVADSHFGFDPGEARVSEGRKASYDCR